jgi:hypothetical protein
MLMMIHQSQILKSTSHPFHSEANLGADMFDGPRDRCMGGFDAPRPAGKADTVLGGQEEASKQGKKSRRIFVARRASPDTRSESLLPRTGAGDTGAKGLVAPQAIQLGGAVDVVVLSQSGLVAGLQAIADKAGEHRRTLAPAEEVDQ